ncbi:SGNH/GDSL hydrolase family protein [Kiritimatiellaeota bacterium B1221]|nr:SGNH/GDSL hydrolase family protein [Kiritimatiellaeota bacterium B1221]
MHSFQSLIHSSQHLRIVGLGSSNTEHFLSGMHWLEILDIGIKQTRNIRNHVCINSGVGGDTTVLALARFERDVAFYKPDVTLVTLGLNDANPTQGISTEDYKANLITIVNQLRDLGSIPLLQTYYACPPERVNAQRYENFLKNMASTREVAAEQDVFLIDQLQRWEQLRLNFPDLYEPLMEDHLHLNRHGNLLMGLELCRALELEVGEDAPDFWDSTRKIQQILDHLDTTVRPA